ncbi:unnamed protein product [Symbiodinium natans]|uniref:Uncharacterized protein n=1 Tax=Symbiodinium natans TaxID=878477 RepID=A0A812PSM5_9DINO|nr:unnamed protein product [Symbiodinium natans]
MISKVCLFAAVHVCLAEFVLDVGAPRSGTQSMFEALKQLGLNPLWSGYYTHLRWTWCDYLFANGTRPPFDNLTGFEAAMDEPFHLLYDEVLQAIPDAKFVYTVADPDSWYDQYLEFYAHQVESADTTIYDRHNYYPGHETDVIHRLSSLRGKQGKRQSERTRADFFPRPLGHPLHGYNPDEEWDSEESHWICTGCRFWGCRFSDPELRHTEEVRNRCLEGFRQHRDRVIRTIPKEQLLIFNLSDGWGPLVEFLGKPTPPIPFPYVDRFQMSLAETKQTSVVEVTSVALVQRGAVRLHRSEL